MKNFFANKKFKVTCDDTDHFYIYCGECKNICEITKTYNKGSKKDRDKCTFIVFECLKCETVGTRKIYWHQRSELFKVFKACLNRDGQK